ncbi:MAG TPA: putative metal-binding motif-containing protein [Polyangiales bacterium]|nr:putative metal-binding motif-containing protein [Polyangiales bacterium]
MRCAWLLALVCTGCTLIELSEDVYQTGCASNMDCEPLNIQDAIEFGECEVWQCDPQTAKCVFGPTDLDHDGLQPSACVAVDKPSDCDDTDAEIKPSATEICDGVDNDCDRSIDEGMLTVRHDTALQFDDDVVELDYMWNVQNQELGVAYRTATDDAAGFNVIGRNYASTAETLQFANSIERVRAQNLAVTASVGRFLLGMTEAAQTQRLWVGEITGSGGYSQLRLQPDLQASGLRCTADESCTVGSPTPTSTRLRMSTLMGQVLVAYARGPESDDCDAPEPRPLLLNMLDEAGLGVRETSEAAVVLDMTDDARAPALLPIQRVLDPFGWLAAYPNAAGDLIVQRVEPTLAAQRRLRILRGEERWTHVQLMAGSAAEDLLTLGIAAQRGCGSAARVVFGVLQLSWDAMNVSTLRVYRELRPISDGPAERPVLAYNARHASWAVAYMNDEGVFARVLDRNGVPIGSAPYPIREGRPRVADIAVAPENDGFFAVYSYDDARALDVGRLSACGEY